MEDFEKVEAIMWYLYYTAYHRENMLKQAEDNLLRSRRTDPFALLEYYKEQCYKEMYDRMFSDISKILYGWGNM